MMVRETNTRDLTGKEILQTSRLYLFIQAERHEVDKLKWIESEKAGRDIGRFQALILWGKYKSQWKQEWRDQNR